MPPASDEKPLHQNLRPRGVIAAAVAIAGIGIGWWVLGKHEERGLSPVEIEALGTLPSGEGVEFASGEVLTMIASYRSRDGKLCRNFETHRQEHITFAVACRAPMGWHAQFEAKVVAQGEIYLPDSGSIEEMHAFLATLGPILSPADEARALAQ
ncbi:hypothetical protein [Paracoccus aminophilus]|nr:hypothetical protein [Paracoccus aminophilus]